jgi:hypothetical protein
MASSDNQPGSSRASGSSSSSGIQSATSTVSDIAQQATERVRDQASHATGQAQEQAQAFLSEQKEVAAEHISGVAKVLHDTVDQLRQRSPGAVTDYAERAADGLDSVADALREQDLRTLVGQVEGFARRQPVLFLAGSVAIGFALARFLKSSNRDAGYSQGFGREGYGGASGAYGSNPRYSSSAGQPGGSGTEYGRHLATESSSDRQGTGSQSSGLSGTAPAMGSSDGPASPQHSTTRTGRSGTSPGDTRQGQRSTRPESG